MKIVLVAPFFFDYHVIIKSSLEHLGHNVILLEEKPSSFLYRVLKRFQLFRDFYSELITKKIAILSNNCDCLIIIRGEIIDFPLLDQLLSKNLSKIYYQWDSFKNNPNGYNVLKYNFKIATFDFLDSVKHKINYVPLFADNVYSQVKDISSSNILYDVVIVGTAHSDRLALFKSFVKSNPKLLILSYFYLDFFVFIKKLIIGNVSLSDLKYYNFRKLSHREIASMFESSYSVLDLHHNSQSGYTSRTYETFSAGRRLVSTNNFIAPIFLKISNDLINLIKISRDDLRVVTNVNNTNSQFRSHRSAMDLVKDLLSL